MDVIRSALCTVILTCPSDKGLLGILTSYDQYQIRISYSIDNPGGTWMRTAKGYIWNTLPSGQKRIYKKYIDEYSCYLPNDVYEKYAKIRMDALKGILVDIDKLLKEEKKE
jgi:hypothetical protein